MRSQIIFSVLFLFLCNAVNAQAELITENEGKLSVLLDSLRAAKTDIKRKAANKEFKKLMSETLKLEGAFTYSFTKLKSVGVIDSPDKMIRIVNWNVEQEDLTHNYYCYILHFDTKKKTVQINELMDNSFMLPPQPDDILTADNWYGALYYKIIPIDKGSKTMYTLLGWDGATSASNIKLIDVLYFNGNQPKLGSPIFKMKDQTVKRIFFEHSEKAVMSLRFEEQYNRIIYDHLSPEAPGLEGFYSFYVPDMSYDALLLNNGKWTLKEDVIGVNQQETSEKVTVYAINEKTGLPEKTEIKNKWMNPEDSKAPVGGIDHKAVTPEDELKAEDSSKGSKSSREKKINDKRDPSQLNSTLGGTKKKKKKRI
jgi:hypothetical protein